MALFLIPGTKGVLALANFEQSEFLICQKMVQNSVAVNDFRTTSIEHIITPPAKATLALLFYYSFQDIFIINNIHIGFKLKQFENMKKGCSISNSA